MLAEVIDRGNEVEFSITFLNRDGEPLNPSDATVTINYLDADGARANEIVDLAAQTDDVWYGVWDSQKARPSRTYWTVRSFSPDSAEDGYFELAGNLANVADESTS